MPATPALTWHADALQQRLAALLPGLTVQVVVRIGSTNTELLARARGVGTLADAGGGPHPVGIAPCLLVAEHQTQGRGRQGKVWQSNLGDSLTFSVLLPLAPADWSGLSLAVGLALADALDPPQPGQPLRLGLKWPNDLLLLAPPVPVAPGAGPAWPVIAGKLGGILIETVQAGAQRLAVVGVGLNLRPPPATPDDTSATAAPGWGYAGLQALHPGLDAPAALARVAAPLLQAVLAFEQAGFAPLRQRFAVRDMLLGRAVTTTLPELPAGTADGVDDSGTLWLRVSAGGAVGGAAGGSTGGSVDGADLGGSQRWPVRSGEVSLRLAGGPPDPPASPAAARC